MAERIRKVIAFGGGREGQLSGVASALLAIGIIGLIMGIIAASTKGGSPLWIAFGIAALIEGILGFALLNAAAEVIRLLKKLNGIGYGGQISRPTELTGYTCSNCGAVLDWGHTKCPKCDSPLQSNSGKAKGQYSAADRGTIGIKFVFQVIFDVAPGSPAELAGLKAGDRIIAVNGVPLTGKHGHDSALITGAPGTTAALRVLRDDQEIDVPVVRSQLSE